MHASRLGLGNLSVMSFSLAGQSIETCDDALKVVSETRSRIGAYTNRLEHVVKNLDNSSENTQAAESLIRDTDIAEEMMIFSKNNILTQAGQAMLSQTFHSSEGVMRLLQA